MKKSLILSLVFHLSTALWPVQTIHAGEQDADTRIAHLSQELRCLVCQNQSIADSNAPLAKDLKVQMMSLVKQGKTDEEVVSYLVERYGDFVTYSPPFKAKTWLLWGGPFILLLTGLFVLVRVIQKTDKATL